MLTPALFSKYALILRRLVLIYQLPKVGSQTIATTLAHHELPCSVLRFHYLSSVFAGALRHGLSSAQPDTSWRHNVQMQLEFMARISQALRWRKTLCRFGVPIPKLEVITGVREPIGLVLASIFENYSYFASTIDALTADKCREALLHPKTFKLLTHWFDLELKHFTDIDVFTRPFPHHQGYMIYENRFAKVLVYRFESLLQLPAVLSAFLKWRIPALINCNRGDSKAYAEQYRSVRERLRLPAHFVRSLYDGKLSSHFYSAEERHQLFLKHAEPSHQQLPSSPPYHSPAAQPIIASSRTPPSLTSSGIPATC